MVEGRISNKVDLIETGKLCMIKDGNVNVTMTGHCLRVYSNKGRQRYLWFCNISYENFSDTRATFSTFR